MRIVRMASLLAALAAACGDDGQGAGKLRIVLEAEETITAGLDVGPELEDTRDCAVRYSKYLVTVGGVVVARTDTGERRTLEGSFVADLLQVGEQGVELGVFDGLAAGGWDQFSYQTPGASAASQPLAGVSESDLGVMRQGGLTYWVEGSVQCPAKSAQFSFQIAVPTLFELCSSNGRLGVAVAEAGTTSANLTLHGDHLWFDSLPSATEGTVQRRAEWLVKADKDGDGKVVLADLASVPSEEVFPSSLGYNLSGGKPPIENARDFVQAQLSTQGHLNGEGECVWR